MAHELSDLSGVDLRPVYHSLLKLKETLTYEGTKEGSPIEERFGRQVDELFSLLGLTQQGPQSLTFTSMTTEDLAKLKITLAGLLTLKPDSEERLAVTAPLGEDTIWSSPNLYRHLQRLEESVAPRTAKAGTRAWTDAFLHRVSAMQPPDKHMVLNMQCTIPAVSICSSSLSTLSGVADYIATVASQHVAATLLRNPDIYGLRMHESSSFFVTQTGFSDLSDQVPRAICGMYAFARFLQKEVIRGALTNGRHWIFLLLKLNDDHDGGSYKQSTVVELGTARTGDGRVEILEPSPDLIAAILMHWIENSFVDLQDDDWFKPF